MDIKILVIATFAVFLLISGCITQQQPAGVPDNTVPQNTAPEQPQTTPETPPANEPPIIPPTTVSGEFTLATGQSVKNIRGTGTFENKLLEIRVKSVVYRQFPMSKIAVFEAVDESGNVVSQRDVRIGRYLNEDLVDQDTYEPVLLDKIYVRDVIVSGTGNSVTIEINK